MAVALMSAPETGQLVSVRSGNWIGLRIIRVRRWRLTCLLDLRGVWWLLRRLGHGADRPAEACQGDIE